METLKRKSITESAATSSIIRRRSNITPEEYFLFQVELGCQFIERIFDVPGYEDMITYYQSDESSRFWSWWRGEWMRQEREVFHALQSQGRYYQDKGEYVRSQFAKMLTCEHVHQSFLTYTKYLSK